MAIECSISRGDDLDVRRIRTDESERRTSKSVGIEVRDGTSKTSDGCNSLVLSAARETKGRLCQLDDVGVDPGSGKRVDEGRRQTSGEAGSWWCISGSSSSASNRIRGAKDGLKGKVEIETGRNG